MNDKIIIGSDANALLFSFEDKEIRSLGWSTAVDVVGTNLTIDQLLPTVEYPGDGYLNIVIAPSDKSMIVSSDGYIICAKHVERDLRLVSYGTLIQYFRDGILKHKMYVDTVERIAQNTFRVQAVSAIGILERQKQYGNIYRGALFSAVLTEIIGDAIPYTVEDNVKNITVYGWIPYGSKRKALHQLLFATGVTLSKDKNGNIYFHFLNTDNQIAVPNERVYLNGEVNYPAFASAVDVTEHSFFALEVDERVVVYDNTDGSERANNTLVVFRDGPMHNLQVTGSLVIHSSGVNYAVISGTGALSGQKYTHSTRVLHLSAENVNDQRENVATVSENYLVSAVNSTNVAKRVLAFYSSRKTVSAGLVLENEKAGDLVAMMDPYKEPVTGFIANMDAVVSNIVKANCKIVTGYVPTGQGNNYTKYVILTGTGVWNIPAEVLSKETPIIEAILISGGHGGYKGENGTNGEHYIGTDISNIEGVGGEGGKAGEGGKVLTITVDCTGKTQISYNCGSGGSSDEEGDATIFGEYTSADGAITPFGVSNLFTGDVYATKGVADGVNGGNGANYKKPSEPISFNGNTWAPGEKGDFYERYGYWAEGGYGGGAAVGSDGGPGDVGDVHRQPNESVWAEGGRGGDGANAAPGEDAIGYGVGGSGGHGGGGAGAGGTAEGSGSNYSSNGVNGIGGQGGLGGQGGPGAIIIYY